MTLCRGFIPVLNMRLSNIKNNYLVNRRYDYNSYEYELEEYLRVTSDERKLNNLSYIEILERIEQNEVDPHTLGMRM